MDLAPTLLDERSWPELVAHVLAHVTVTAHLPASLYDSTYVRFAERHAGPSQKRPLAEDAAVLGQILSTHDQLAEVQLLAWLFDDVDQASRCAHRDLADLDARDVTRPRLLPPLVERGAPVELLRCAAQLEQEPLASLPPLAIDGPLLLRTLGKIARAAPQLAQCGLLTVRALRLRGRVFGDEIWVGSPGPELDLEIDHVAWQAGHEATVREVGETMDRRLGERQVERIAVVLLAERAAEVGLGHGHAKWLSHFGDLRPDTDRVGLDDTSLAVLATCHGHRG